MNEILVLCLIIETLMIVLLLIVLFCPRKTDLQHYDDSKPLAKWLKEDKEK